MLVQLMSYISANISGVNNISIISFIIIILIIILLFIIYFYLFIYFFSSPEHEVLMVSYCGQSMSVVRRPSSVDRRQQLL